LKRNIFFAFQIALLTLVMQAMATAQQASSAEQQNDADAQVQQMREEHRGERKKIVAANVPLTEQEAAQFWSVYDRYRSEMATKVYDPRYALIKEYAQSYAKMTEDQADSFITRWVALDSEVAQVQAQYVPEFEKVISRKKTAKFFQVDRRVTLMFELQLAGKVPLLQP